MFLFFYDEIRVYSFFLGRDIIYRVLIKPEHIPHWSIEQDRLAAFSLALGLEIVAFLAAIDIMIIVAALT
jgi:hypothetical protein